MQHAHQKGIIHRDIKPNNVLVAEYDSHAVPKVIDFGVAKATAQKLTERTMFTEFGQVLGTMEYMSPEQAKFNQLDIDTRSDIYSLGVLLYELLAGSTPFEGKRLHDGGVRRNAADHSRGGAAQTQHTAQTLDRQALPSVAVNRHSEPPALSRATPRRAGLDRDEGAGEGPQPPLRDGQRASPPTCSAICTTSRCRPARRRRDTACGKFARRNKAAFVTGSAIAAAVMVAVGSLISGVFVLAASNDAERNRRLNVRRRLRTSSASPWPGASWPPATSAAPRSCSTSARAQLRGWEWHFLKRQRYGNPAPLQHEDTVIRVAFSPDGRQIASVCMDGTIEICDARTGGPLHTLEPQTVLSAGPSVAAWPTAADSRYLAMARHDGVVRVWDATGGQLLHTLEGHNGPSWQVAFSPDSRTLASAARIALCVVGRD